MKTTNYKYNNDNYKFQLQIIVESLQIPNKTFDLIIDWVLIGHDDQIQTFVQM